MSVTYSMSKLKVKKTIEIQYTNKLPARLKKNKTMTQPTINKPTIFRLLDIHPDSSKIYFLIFTPVFGLWLFAIGKRLLQKQNKSNKVFTVIASLTVILSTYIFFMLLIFWIKGSDTSEIKKFISPIVAITCFLLFATIGILSYITVKYDRLDKPNFHFSLANSTEYFTRFFALIYFWSFQEKVNEYNQ